MAFPGLNAVIRAVVSHATLTYNWQVVGIPYATRGLLERKAIPLKIHGLDLRGIDPLLNMGGTILGSINKGDTLVVCQANFATLNSDINAAFFGEHLWFGNPNRHWRFADYAVSPKRQFQKLMFLH